MEDICLCLSKFEYLGRKSCSVLEDYQKSLILATETENTKHTLSEPYENKSKELLLEIVMVALEGCNLVI